MVDLELRFPDGFFREEDRDGYLVSKKMKEVWAVELDLLNKFMQICDKHRLQYYIDGGSLLGAIRHGGFIPWDNDIDIVMMRSEYEEFCRIAQAELCPPYFLQNIHTDPGSLKYFSCLMNLNTTCIVWENLKYQYQHKQSIFIDIFPLDAAPDDPQLLEDTKRRIRDSLLKEYQLAKNTDRYVSWAGHGLKKARKTLIHHVCRGPLKGLADHTRYYREFERESTKYNGSATRCVAPFCTYPAFCIASPGRRLPMIPRECYASASMTSFEILQVPIPVGFDGVLTATYGDWRTPVQYHDDNETMIFDTDMPYTEYFEGIRKGIISPKKWSEVNE